MKNLGEKGKGLYDGPATPESQKNTVTYPEIGFPLSLVEGLGLKVDDDVDIHIKGRVCGLEDTKWSKRVSFEAKEGEVKKIGKRGESVLEEA